MWSWQLGSGDLNPIPGRGMRQVQKIICCLLIVTLLSGPTVFAAGKDQLARDAQTLEAILKRAAESKAADPRLLADLNEILSQLQDVSRRLVQVQPTGMEMLKENIQGLRGAVDRAKANRSAHSTFLQDLEGIIDELDGLEARLGEQSPSKAEEEAKPAPAEGIGQLIGLLLPMVIELFKSEDESQTASEITTEQELIAELAAIGIDYHQLTEEEKAQLRQEYLTGVE